MLYRVTRFCSCFLQGKHNTEVYAVAIKILQVVSTSQQIQPFLVRKGIMTSLLDFFHSPSLNLNQLTIEGKMQGFMLAHLSNYLLYLSSISHRVNNLQQELLRHDVIGRLIDFLQPRSQAYGFNEQAKKVLKQSVVRKPLKARVQLLQHEKKTFQTILAKSLRREMSLKNKTQSQESRLANDFYELDLFSTTSRATHHVVDDIIEQGYAMRYNHTKHGDAGVDDETDVGNIDVVITHTENPPYAWANIGTESISLTETVQTAIASVPVAERVYLTRPPVERK